MYSNISQILLLYKMWGYHNKFDSTKSLRICYWCVKIPQCGYMGHGLKLITFYVKKHIAGLARCHNPSLVRDNPLGAPASVKMIYTMPADVLVTLAIDPKSQNILSQASEELSTKGSLLSTEISQPTIEFSLGHGKVITSISNHEIYWVIHAVTATIV